MQAITDAEGGELSAAELYELFNDKEACYLELCDELAVEILDHMAAVGTDRDWRAAPDESSREVEVASSSAGEREQDMPVETSPAHNRERELETEENFFYLNRL